MKIKIIEACHELDLQDDVNEFLSSSPHIYDIKYQVAMCFSNELEYSFSCMILYDE